MSTLVLIALACTVVAWVARQAAATDNRDETERFARVQHLVAGWTVEPTEVATAAGSQSDNDLAHSADCPVGAPTRAV